MTLKAILVDDEPLALEVVSVFLKQIPDVEIIDKCESAMEAIKILNHTKVDVIFLDIQMPALNGLDFIRTLTHKPRIVIISAYRNYAVESYDLDVVDYLVKPITFARLLKSINKVSQLMPSRVNQDPTVKYEEVELANETKNENILIKADKKIHKIKQDQILYIESLKDYVRIKTDQENYISYCTLSKITSQLCPENFIRVHRSFTVSLKKIETIDGNFAVISGNYIPISRKMKLQVMKGLNKICL